MGEVTANSYPPTEWASACRIQKIEAQEAYGSGVACLAMVTGQDYSSARQAFVKAGLAQRRGGKVGLSTNMAEMSAVITIGGLANTPRKWAGWNQFRGLGIIKIRYRTEGRDRWYWAVAFTHREYGVVLFDPHDSLPSFRCAPMDVLMHEFDKYEVVGKWLQVENIHAVDDDA